MKIELKSPFTTKYITGTMSLTNENEKTVSLLNVDGTIKTISYADYVYSVHLDRIIDPKKEIVTRINGDLTNDDLENLQLSPVIDKRLMNARRRGRSRALITCPVCSTYFSITKDRSPALKSRRKKVIFCSVDCGIKFRSVPRTPAERIKVSEKSVVKVYKSRFSTVEERSVKIVYDTLESAFAAIKKEEDSYKDYIASLPKQIKQIIIPEKIPRVSKPKDGKFVLNFLPPPKGYQLLSKTKEC